MHCSPHIFDSMVHYLVGILARETAISRPGVGVYARSVLNSLADFRLQCFRVSVLNNLSFNPACLAPAFALQDTKNDGFPDTACTPDLLGAFPLVHVLCQTADKSFVGFGFAAHFEK